jgi:hypothetical protein
MYSPNKPEKVQHAHIVKIRLRRTTALLGEASLSDIPKRSVSMTLVRESNGTGYKAFALLHLRIAW